MVDNRCSSDTVTGGQCAERSARAQGVCIDRASSRHRIDDDPGTDEWDAYALPAVAQKTHCPTGIEQKGPQKNRPSQRKTGILKL